MRFEYPPLLMHKRYAQCRADNDGASNIGTFACRTFRATPKQAKEPIEYNNNEESGTTVE